jgi:hypothetical protein
MASKMKIGIPRALIYWKRPYFGESFFENLRFKVGVKISDPETDFSNKVYFGYLKWLEGKYDLIFVLRLRRKGNFEYCLKFFKFPDLAKILVKTKILTRTFKEIMEKINEVLKYKINGSIEISSYACGCNVIF